MPNSVPVNDGLSEIAEGARPRPLGGQGGNAGSRDSRPALPAETDQLIAEDEDRPVAALFVETNGVYFGLPGVDPWDIERDARNYRGSVPVVAHPPCNRFSRLATFRRQRDGQDGGCFAHALWAVREFGGVLEHPADSLAWQLFGLPKPAGAGWTKALGDDGWTCLVDQRWYGHEMRKPTWLYLVGDPPQLTWGKGPRSDKSVHTSYGGGPRQAMRSRSPEPFRDLLIGMARSVYETKAVAA